jgi:predicted Zn-dependent protease
MAQLLQAKGANQEAATMLEQVVKQLPDFTQAHVVLARLYFKLGRPADAERERVIINRLNAEQQKKEPGAKPDGTNP